MKKELREKIYNDNFGRCGYCGTGIEYRDMQVDHIISQENFKRDILHKEVFVPEFLKHLTLEDVNHIDNLIATCRSCNNYKSAYTLENFRRELGLQLERLNKNTNYKLASRYGLIEETNKKIEFFFEKYIDDNNRITHK